MSGEIFIIIDLYLWRFSLRILCFTDSSRPGPLGNLFDSRPFSPHTVPMGHLVVVIGEVLGPTTGRGRRRGAQDTPKRSPRGSLPKDLLSYNRVSSDPKALYGVEGERGR